MSEPIERALTHLMQKGFRRTPQRARIVEVLSRGGRPMTAREIHADLREDFPRISLDTVYRNLELLRRTGLADQINLQRRESARFELHCTEDHHHHLVCVQCGKSLCLPRCPVDVELIASSEVKRFTVVGHAFELYGYCLECR